MYLSVIAVLQFTDGMPYRRATVATAIILPNLGFG